MVIEVDRRFAQLTSVIRLETALRAPPSLEYSSIVPITLFRYMRFPSGPFSDQRNCQTSGPSRRGLVVRLPCCIVILLPASAGQGRCSPIRVQLAPLGWRPRTGGELNSRNAKSESRCGGRMESERMFTQPERECHAGPGWKECCTRAVHFAHFAESDQK